MSDTAFSYKTRGNAAPDNKPRVYFTCHLDDFDRCFDEVCNGIFEVNDCAVFFTEDMKRDFSDENLIVDLERMSLFVIPVTYKLLTTPNRTMSFDYRFAKDKKSKVSAY